MAEPPDLSFLAPPETLADWRMVLAYEAAAQAGVLAALPGTLPELAGLCTVAENSLGAVLGQLAAWEIVTLHEDGCYTYGPQAPSPPQDDVLLNHAATIRRWAALLGPRLHERTALPAGFPTGPPAPSRVRPDLLAINARRLTGPLAEACLARFPDARSVLDLGGGHGEHALELTRRGLHATVQDLPAIIEAADRDSRLSNAGITLFAGDFFDALPDGPFDLVLCAAVTNMFDGPRNLDLYRRLAPLIAPGGGLVIVSYLRERDRVTASFGLQMLAWTDSGDAHIEDDYRGWLDEAGYGPVDVHEFDHPPQTALFAAR